MFVFISCFLVDFFFFFCYCILSLKMTARASPKNASFFTHEVLIFFLLKKSAINKVRINNLIGMLDFFIYFKRKKC